MLGIPWTAKRTNTFMLADSDRQSTLESKILKLKLSYFGHIIPCEGLEKAMMLGIGNSRRSRNRPSRRWINEVTKSTGLTLQQLKEAARNRNVLRRLLGTEMDEGSWLISSPKVVFDLTRKANKICIVETKYS